MGSTFPKNTLAQLWDSISRIWEDAPTPARGHKKSAVLTPMW